MPMLIHALDIGNKSRSKTHCSTLTANKTATRGTAVNSMPPMVDLATSNQNVPLQRETIAQSAATTKIPNCKLFCQATQYTKLAENTASERTIHFSAQIFILSSGWLTRNESVRC